MAIDETAKTGPLSDSSISSSLPDNFSIAIDDATGKTYYLNLTTKTTSWLHPRCIHLGQPFTPGVPYQYERQTDKKGRFYYLNHENRTSSWLSPVKLAELKATGILDEEMDPLVSDGKAELNWPWSLKEVIESGSQKGESYWVNYRQAPDGCANNRGHEDTKAAYLTTAEVRVVRERDMKL